MLRNPLETEVDPLNFISVLRIKKNWCITVCCIQASDALEAIAVNRMSCNISDYCANKMTLKMTITAPVIITNPKVVTE